MSKLLKIIVNVFLIGAILIAAAILIPPLAGVTTTIVDTSAMNTNLPLGSVTYSTDVDVFKLKAGDEILKENDSSTYAYIIKETDAANGRFQVVSSTDPNGAQEEIRLRNSVPKVAVIIPYIGYILIAMHSIEGIIIVVLIVVLMIILFILSELWKVHPEDEEDEEESEEGQEEPQVTAKEETGIDTDAIRAAVAENNNAALGMDDESLGREVDELQASAGTVVSDTTVIEELSSVPDAVPGEDSAAMDAFVFGTAAAAGASAASADGTSDGAASANTGPGMPEEAGKSLLPIGDTEEDRKISEALSEYGIDAPKEAAPDTEGGSHTESAAAFPESKILDDTLVLPESREETDLYSPWQEPGLPELNDSLGGQRPEAVSDDTKRFVPVSRPSYEDILNENDGVKDPNIKKDEKSGISVVDLSDQL